MAEKETPQERRERIKSVKIKIIENNPGAVVIVPNSPITMRLVNAVRTYDALDETIRSRAGLQIPFETFIAHMEAFDEVSRKIEETTNRAIQLIAESDIDLRQIRDRRLRKSVERLRNPESGQAETDKAE